jgi:hypothetical protein
MIAYRSRSRIAAWIALAGMALNAFWPLLANARPNVPALSSEICSATGLQHTAENSPGEAPGKSVRPSHCTLCPFNAERGPAISGAASTLLFPTPACEKAPASFTGSLLQTAPVLSGSPRSPPALS